MVGTESWLNLSITFNEIFHLVSMFSEETDLTGHGGGVFICCNKSFAIQEIPLTTDFEVVACKLQLNTCSSLIIVALYRAPSTDYDYLGSLVGAVHGVVSDNPSATVWIAGDIKLPNIDWVNYCIKSNNYPFSFVT